MAMLLDDIPWGEPLLPTVSDPAWEAEVKRRGGQVSEADRRVAPSRWLREAALSIATYRPSAMPQRLLHIGALVTSQENACRYCYGANRAYMKILGYPEAFIHRIERDVHMAELDDRERGFIAFCRSLARSRPRPSRSAGDALVALGYSRLAVNEMAFVISMGCFYNRISTFMVCPPERGFERMANGPLGRVMGWAAPLVRWFSAVRPARPADTPLDAPTLAKGRFGTILEPLAGLPAATVMKAAVEGAFVPDVLGAATKVLMLAVVARTLACPWCEAEARTLLLRDGMAPSDLDATLATLHGESLPPAAAGLLSWTRSTVYYETAKIQHETRALGAAIGERALLEAIGVASLANAMVRLAMLHE